MSFTESNTVEQMILDTATTLGNGSDDILLQENPQAGWGGSLGKEFKPSRWISEDMTQNPRGLGKLMATRWGNA